MEYLNNFIITLVITMVFMTAVEVISPDNSMKKYIKFVLGLILISVMITPIISFFTGGEQQVIEAIENYGNMLYEDTTRDSGDNSISEAQIESFKSNLNNNCDSMLKNQFSGKNFQSSIECTLDLEEMTYAIDSVQVGVEDKGVKLIENININLDEAEQAVSSEVHIEDEIKSYLSEMLGIPSENIVLYSIGG